MKAWMNSNFLLLMSEANVPGPQNVKKKTIILILNVTTFMQIFL